jgi:hypothetical protein
MSKAVRVRDAWDESQTRQVLGRPPVGIRRVLRHLPEVTAAITTFPRRPTGGNDCGTFASSVHWCVRPSQLAARVRCRVAGAATVHLCIRGAHDTSFPSSRLALPPLAADDAGLVDAALLLGHWSSSNNSKSSPKKTSRPPGTIGHRPIDLVAAGKGERL